MKFRLPLCLVTLLLLVAPSMAFAQPASGGDDATQMLPEPDEFIAVETVPEFDMKELQANIVYPSDAREKNLEGVVVLRVLVDEKGKVSRAFAIKSDHAELESAAIDAVMKTTFSPAMANAQPITVWTMVPVKFQLQ